MNAKKQQRKYTTRRLPKVSSLGKGSLKAKMSIIGTKRISLYPGFLLNGVASGTTKNPRGCNNSSEIPEDSLLSEKLQVFIDKQSVNSQRITDKHSSVEEIDLNIPKSKERRSSLRSFAKSLEPVSEKNSKSVFKKISNRMFKIPVEPETDNNGISQTGYLTEEECNNHEIISSPQLVQSICSGEYSKTFTRKMQVLLKSNYFPNKSCENIAAEILKQNSIVEGKLPKDEIAFEDKAEDRESDDLQENFVRVPLVPSKRWVYDTPKNQKIKKRKVKQCQLEPALLLDNKTVKIIKPLLNHNGEFIGKVAAEQRPSYPTGYFEKELHFTQSELNQRIHPMEINTYLESPAHSENDITFIGHDLTTQQRVPNKSYKDDYKNEKNLFDFCSQPKNVFDI